MLSAGSGAPDSTVKVLNTHWKLKIPVHQWPGIFCANTDILSGEQSKKPVLAHP